MKYHIWTAGCQMNVADSRRVAASLENLGYQYSDSAENADVIVLNTCVVRQSAEDKAYGRLSSLKPLKRDNPDLVINLMGCLVGIKAGDNLQKRFPFVDVFSPPSDPGPLVAFLTQNDSRLDTLLATETRHAVMDGYHTLPENKKGKQISVHVPVVYGCSHACTFCIIPYRRGIERSRPANQVIKEIQTLVHQGVKEVTLLGQIVDRYGKDLSNGANLSSLLKMIHKIDGIERIRFLTSHPNWMTDELLETIRDYPKVMPHIEVPVQAGSDQVLTNMRRGYLNRDYRELIDRIRKHVPGVAIATDVIVGFPGETHEQFMETVRLLDDLRLDVAHLARYSLRSGTVATRTMVDNVGDQEKMNRFRILEELQEKILTEINAQYLDKTTGVLFEEQVKSRWKGRTETNKIVFVDSDFDLLGKILAVKIQWTGPWSMQGKLPIKVKDFSARVSMV